MIAVVKSSIASKPARTISRLVCYYRLKCGGKTPFALITLALGPKTVDMPMKIAVITDTDLSLPAGLAAEYGIRQVPVTIQFEDGSSFASGVDIDDRLLFEKIDRQKKLPTTAAPTPGAFASAFDDAFNAGAEAIICICVSSKVSATYNSALTAAEMFSGQKVTVIDSLNLSMGQGFMALAAVEAIRQGAGIEAAAEQALAAGGRIHTYVLLSTLKYLAMGGRVGKFAAGMGDTLNIKPILTVQDGKLDLLERIRTNKKAHERLLELTSQAVGEKSIERMAFLHVNNLPGAQEFQTQLGQVVACPPGALVTELTPGLSVHAGAGAFGVAVLTR